MTRRIYQEKQGKFVATQNSAGGWSVVWHKIMYEPAETICATSTETDAKHIADALNRLRQ